MFSFVELAPIASLPIEPFVYLVSVRPYYPKGNLTCSIAETTGFSVLNWLRNIIECTLNYIPEPIKHTKVVFSDILLIFGQGITNLSLYKAGFVTHK